MVRTEAERQFYLGRAGIHLWYARKALPGAAPSPEFVFPVEEPSEPEPAVAVPRPVLPARHPGQRREADGVGKDRIAGIQALMAESAPATSGVELPAEARESKVAVSETEPPVEAGVEEEPDGPMAEAGAGEIRAQLGFWASDHAVLVSGVSDQASARLQDVLAQNILAAIGGSRIEKWRELRWPVFGNPRVPGNGPNDFRDTLRSLAAEFGGRKVILLGVLVEEFPGSRPEWLSAALGDFALDFPHSLAGLAAAPALKRELWQQLKSAVGG